MKDHCDCGQKLIWAVTDLGNRMPLNDGDPAGGPEPNVAAIQTVDGAWLCRVVSTRDRQSGVPLRRGERMFVPHFATCTLPSRKGGDRPPSTRRKRAAPQAEALF